MSFEPVQVYLGIGSNIDPETSIRRALEALGQEFGQVQCSPIYWNRAQGFDGPDFINLVVGFSTSKVFADLDEILKRIEASCGRDRSSETCKGSRTLDLDILLFGSFQGELNGCHLPRPEIFDRQFVWQPLLALFDQAATLNEFESSIQQQLRALSNSINLNNSVSDL
ncbi:MAG: 2-amino-4-hydroxy-6-hydroxymethyldihydropteridine diphosphokinase [Gammaproteobacteria bacterium]